MHGTVVNFTWPCRTFILYIHLRNHACREPGAIITVDYVYRTVKNIGGEKTSANLANYSILPIFLTKFHNFLNIPYANGPKFNLPGKVFSAKLPQYGTYSPNVITTKVFTVWYT